MSQIIDAHAQVLRRLRKGAGITQAELAARCRLDRTFISLLERGERQPSLETLFAIAKALRTDPATVVTLIQNYARRGMKNAQRRTSLTRL